MGEFIVVLVPIVLLVMGLVVGGRIEKSHYRSIHERERAFLNIPATDLRRVADPEKIQEARLVYGSAVISVDYLKRFLAGLRAVFGGEIVAYSSLLDRARREALLRMKESFPDADAYVNCRIETASVSKGQGKTIGTVEVLAYGTALQYRK